MASEDNVSGLIWFVAGAALGAALGLLYAPASGEETRRKLAEKAQEGGGALADRGREVVDKGRDLYEKGRKVADEAAEMFEKGRKLVEKIPPPSQRPGTNPA